MKGRRAHPMDQQSATSWRVSPRVPRRFFFAVAAVGECGWIVSLERRAQLRHRATSALS